MQPINTYIKYQVTSNNYTLQVSSELDFRSTSSHRHLTADAATFTGPAALHLQRAVSLPFLVISLLEK